MVAAIKPLCGLSCNRETAVRGGGEPRKVEAADALNPIYVDWSHRTNRLVLTTNRCDEGIWVYDDF